MSQRVNPGIEADKNDQPQDDEPVLRQASKIDENRQIDGSRHMAKGQKTGGRQKGSRNKSTRARVEAAAKVVELVGDVIPDAFAGDAHAFLVGIYKDPRVEREHRECQR